MKEIIRLNLYVFSLVLFFCMNSSCAAVKETTTLPLLSCQIGLLLPHNEFRIKRENYEEGVFYTLFNRNGAYIIVFEGALMQFLPEDTASTFQIRRYKERTVSMGVANNLFYRKDSIGGVRLFYNRVTAESKKSFDKILNSAKITHIAAEDRRDGFLIPRPQGNQITGTGY